MKLKVKRSTKLIWNNSNTEFYRNIASFLKELVDLSLYHKIIYLSAY